MIQRELGRSVPGGLAAFGIDWTVLAGAVACGLLTALACGLAPLAASWRAGLLAGLHSGSRTATEGRGSHRTRSVLIALEVAASLALLAGSTLMIQSVVALVRSDPGIRPERLLSASITLRQRNYPDAAQPPGLLRAGVPARRGNPRRGIGRARDVVAAPGAPAAAHRSGRVRAAAQRSGSAWRRSRRRTSRRWGCRWRPAARSSRPTASATEPVAIVSEALARRISPDGRALGARVSVPENGPRAAGADGRSAGGRDCAQRAADAGRRRSGRLVCAAAAGPGPLRDDVRADVRRAGRLAAAASRGVQGDRSGDSAQQRAAAAGRHSTNSSPGRHFWPGCWRASRSSPRCWRSSGSTASSRTRCASGSARLPCGSPSARSRGDHGAVRQTGKRRVAGRPGARRGRGHRRRANARKPAVRRPPWRSRCRSPSRPRDSRWPDSSPSGGRRVAPPAPIPRWH